MSQVESIAPLQETAPPWLAAPADGTVPDWTVARARIRAIELVKRDTARASFPVRIAATLAGAWRWLTHSIRVALFTDHDAHRALLQDPAGVRTLIERTRVALVTTRDRSGALHSEPMEATERDFDGAVWFATHESAPMLERVQARAAVQLTYHDKHSNRCVVLDGMARICAGTGSRANSSFIRVDVVSADAWD